MAQPDHIEITLTDERKIVRRAINDLGTLNRLLAQKDERIRELEARLAAEYGISMEVTQ